VTEPKTLEAPDGVENENGTTEQTGEEQEDLSIDALIAERDGYLDQLQRTAADFANFRRRTEQERAMIRQLANRDLLLHVLDVMDDFGRALAAVPEEQRESGWVSGTAMIEKKLYGVLERAGVRPIEALGQPFDPALHEAVAGDPGSDGSTVVEVYRQGYRLGEGLLRPAMVKVGNRPVA
jgi:molecular chaperone GrpE